MNFKFDLSDEQDKPPSNVFALATPHHLLIKLHWEVRQLRASLPSKRRPIDLHEPAYHAFNCAITCWHLTDWVWESADEERRQLISSNFGVGLRKIEDFQSALRLRHRSLHICWQIANGSKHFKLRKTDPNIKTDEMWEYRPAMAGRMQAGEPLGSYVYRLSLTDGDLRLEALDVFEDAMKAWERELAAWFFIEGGYVGPET
jgi:hypothetical protein